MSGATDTPRTPQHVACDACGHAWVAAYLPMEMGVFARLLKGLHCPVCGGGSKTITLRESHDVPPATTVTISPSLRAWLREGERGISSNAIVEHLTGVPALNGRWGDDHPHDGGDLGRCVRLLEAVPELQPLFPQMASRSPEWAALVAHWDELTERLRAELAHEPGAKYGTYARMREVLHPIDQGGLYTPLVDPPRPWPSRRRKVSA